MSARLRLRRADGAVYLDRWGIELGRIGGIFLHRMDAADPGLDLHDHPWWFVRIVLAGGYTEEIAATRSAPFLAYVADKYPGTCTRGLVEEVRRWRPTTLRLEQCHRITALRKRRSWSLVIHGPKRRSWGFYLPSGYMPWREYDATVRAERRDLWADGDKRRHESSRGAGPGEQADQ